MVSENLLAKLKQIDGENRKVLAHQRKLQADLAGTIKEVGGGGCSYEEIISKLSAMQEDTAAFGEYLRVQLKPKYYHEIRTDDSTIATTVFDIPELSELILLRAEVQDIMAIQQVNKNLRDIINTSSKIQTKLYLKPEDERDPEHEDYLDEFRAYYRSHFSKGGVPGFKVWTYGARVEATFKRKKVPGGLPEVGERWMKMFICQPPVKTLFVDKVCASCRIGGNEQGEISSEYGLTVHELYEKAKEVFATRSTCFICSNLPDTGTQSRMTKARAAIFRNFTI
jgi:hypothetical protein